MSFKWGLNGNDLRWDYMPYDWECKACAEAIREAKREGKDDRWIENNIVCDGHTHKYKGRNWAIYHDTNGNFVSTTGSVPLAVFNDDYLKDMLQSDSISASKKSRIKKELQYRERVA